MANNQNEEPKASTLHDLGQFLPYVSCRTSFMLYRVCVSAFICYFPVLSFEYMAIHIHYDGIFVVALFFSVTHFNSGIKT